MSYDTKEQILKLGEIDPEFEQFLKENPLPQVDYNLDTFLPAARERAAQLRKVLGDPPPFVKQTELTYPTRDGESLGARLFQPTTPPDDGSPLIVLFYGGGFCGGSPDGETQTARNLVEAFGAVCIVPVYRLAPQHPFPCGPKDAWDALQWAAKNATSWGADPSIGFIVGGTSAGGNITSVLAHMARDEGLSPPLTGQYLAIPAVCSQSKTPKQHAHLSYSYEQNANAPVLPQAAIDMFMGGYKPDPEDAVWFNTLLHPNGHADQPRAFFQVDGLDPLRDEALIYERVLREQTNIPTRLKVYPGLPHGHWGFFPMLQSAKKFRAEQVEGFGWLLGRDPDKLVKKETVGVVNAATV